jgi:hypothetical protein
MSKIPQVHIGETVYWYPQGMTGNKPIAAVVTDTGIEHAPGVYSSLCLAALVPSFINLRCVDGVRHATDTQAKSAEVMESGVWERVEERVARDEAKRQRDLAAAKN